MADAADWQKLAAALRDLHRALMQRARRDYKRERLEVLNPAQLLQLLAPFAESSSYAGLGS